MLKPFNRYSLEIWASVNQGIAAQILCHQGTKFVGRIDFYVGEPIPTSYLWHPTGTSNPDLIYLVLAMGIDRFEAVEQILRTEKPFALELWPSGNLGGAATDGYAGVLRSEDDMVVGGLHTIFSLSRARAAEGKVLGGDPGKSATKSK
jgi:hypothetical protein